MAKSKYLRAKNKMKSLINGHDRRSILETTKEKCFVILFSRLFFLLLSVFFPGVGLNQKLHGCTDFSAYFLAP